MTAGSVAAPWWALPTLSALLLAASYPPLHPVVLPFVGLVPLALAVVACDAEASGRRDAVRAGFLFGWVHFAVVLHWMPLALARETWLAVPAWLVWVTLLSTVGGLVGWVIHSGRVRLGLPLVLVLPVAWSAGEWFRAHWPGPLAFPWLDLGTALAGTPELAGIAELVGSRGVGFWMAAVNGLVATALLRGRGGGAGRSGWALPAVAAVVVTAVPMAWGIGRADALDVGPVARVALVQPAIGVDVRRSPAVVDSTLAAVERVLAGLAEEADGAGPDSSRIDLIVLPEAVVPRAIRGGGGPGGAVGRMTAYARAFGVPVMFGAFGAADGSSVGEGSGPPEAAPLHNSAFLARPTGLDSLRYDKRFLVPGVERTVLGGGWGGAAGGSAFAAGRDWPVFEVGGVGYGATICYESSYPQAARALRRAGADVLVNLTNDAWFGDGRGVPVTAAFHQHPAHVVMRAIEHRIGAVRVANTGVTMVVAPSGRSEVVVPPLEEGAAVRVVSSTEGLTWYGRLGDVVGWGAVVGAALMLGVAGAGGRVRPSGAD